LADLAVAGAGMAGLVAAAEARRLGARPVVFEKLDRAGGSMRLSSGVVWRHRDFALFRSECPGGDERLQRRLFERLDEDLRWLESLGAPVVERETGNELTVGVRFDVEGLTAALVEAAGGVRLGAPLTDLAGPATVILATGGFGANRELLREHVTPQADHVLLRAAPGSTGDGLRLGLAAGAAKSDGLGDVYARAMPAPPARVRPTDFVALSQLYARHARVTNERGERHDNSTWSEVDTAAWMARQPRARAWFRVENGALAERVRERRVGDMVAAAEAAGAPVERDPAGVTVECVAGVTTTLGGLAIDEQGQAAPGVFACGADAGGIATGGYASGLAAALVFGRLAARAALGESP
jgi:fumarate reductase flavoprotein subunit